MKRLLIATPLLAFALSGLLPVTGASATGTGAMSVSVLKSTRPSHIKLGGRVNFHVKVTGILLTIAKKNKPGQGHIQVYLNKIPKDAHRKFDRRHWLGSLADTKFSFGFPKGIVPGKGIYKILIALAKNNSVLYHVTPAIFKLTVK